MREPLKGLVFASLRMNNRFENFGGDMRRGALGRSGFFIGRRERVGFDFAAMAIAAAGRRACADTSATR